MRTILEPAKLDFAISGIEMNVQACGASQAGRRHLKTLRT
jgi:hypothetical protein